LEPFSFLGGHRQSALTCPTNGAHAAFPKNICALAVCEDAAKVQTELCLSGERRTVTDHSQDSRLKKLLRRIRRLLKREPEPPEDPYAYVGAPQKPRLPHRSASAAVEPEP